MTTKEEVKPLTAEQLAKKTHEAFNTTCGGRPNVRQWRHLAPNEQEKYRATARLLVAKYDVTLKRLKQGEFPM